MAALSHFRPSQPLLTPLTSYQFSRPSPLCHGHRRNQIITDDRVAAASRFCTANGSGAPLLGRLTARTVPCRPSLTAFAGFNSVEQTSLQASAAFVVSLLHVLWIATTLPILAASKIPAVHELILSFSRRGKILESSSNKLSVPQKFFCHFYMVGVIWTTFLLAVTWLYASQITPIISEPYGIWRSVFLLILMEAQVLRRLFESIFVFKYSPSARMHVVGYFTGLFFYTAAPLSLCCTYSVEVFNFAGRWFVDKGIHQVMEFDILGLVNHLMQLDWYVWIGAAVFSWGWIHQLRCHAILGSLRKNNQQTSAYLIPEGDWFEFVSSPHYLAEIVLYGGLVIASGLSDITIWLVFGFVVGNLTFAAIDTHKWYLTKFDNYPRNRYAIFPFVW